MVPTAAVGKRRPGTELRPRGGSVSGGRSDRSQTRKRRKEDIRRKQIPQRGGERTHAELEIVSTANKEGGEGKARNYHKKEKFLLAIHPSKKKGGEK